MMMIMYHMNTMMNMNWEDKLMVELNLSNCNQVLDTEFFLNQLLIQMYNDHYDLIAHDDGDDDDDDDDGNQ